MDIHRACRTNDIKWIEKAIDSGADLNELDEFDSTPLSYAISEGNPRIALLLLAGGADVTPRIDRGRTALHYAVEYDQFDVAERILECNAEVARIPDDYGNTPIWTAAFNARGDYRYVRLIRSYGGDPKHRNEAGLCALDLADRFNDKDLRLALRGTITSEGAST